MKMIIFIQWKTCMWDTCAFLLLVGLSIVNPYRTYMFTFLMFEIDKQVALVNENKNLLTTLVFNLLYNRADKFLQL